MRAPFATRHRMRLTFDRTPELFRETRDLTAELYNKQRVLWMQTHEPSLFVPIRAMQYLAVIDREEIIFVDALRPSWVAISWQRFRSRQRDGLQTPVTYDCVIYQADAFEVDKRLQQAFFVALEALAQKQPKPEGGARLTPFKPVSSEPSEADDPLS